MKGVNVNQQSMKLPVKIKVANLRNFGMNVMIARKRKGVSQEKLAELIDCSTNYISNIETGNANTTVKIIVALAEVLEVEMNTLFKDV